MNPHLDVSEGTLDSKALVNLINSVWTLLHTYKNVSQKVENLEEQNHILEHNNKQLNVSMTSRMVWRLNAPNYNKL